MARGYAELNPVRAGDIHLTQTFSFPGLLSFVTGPITHCFSSSPLRSTFSPAFLHQPSPPFLFTGPLPWLPGGHFLHTSPFVSSQGILQRAVETSWRGAPWVSTCCSTRGPGPLALNAGFSVRFLQYGNRWRGQN